MQKNTLSGLTVAAFAAVLLLAGGCKGAADLANKAMDKTNETLAKKAAYEFMVARMSTDYGKLWDMTTPEMHDMLLQLAKKRFLQHVKSSSEKKRINSLPDRERYVAIMNAKDVADPYPKMSNFTIKDDTWTFAEKKAEVMIELKETQADNTQTTKLGRMALNDVGDAWLVADIKDEPAK